MKAIDLQIDNFFERSPFSDDKYNKEALMLPLLIELIKFHYNNCIEYRNILDALQFDFSKADTFELLPFLPVGLFKHLDLFSISPEEISRHMNSSGTTGQVLSKVYLDKNTAMLQRRILAKIASEVIGNKRLPMVIIDKKSSITNRMNFSASAAGIIGFSSFSSSQFFALNEDLSLNLQGLQDFLDLHKSEKKFIFGFTSMIWTYLIQALCDTNIVLNLSNSVLIHGGGWKKLQNEKITAKEFRGGILRNLNINEIYDYYGMVEQTGSIFLECSEHYLHASNFSAIIIRDPLTFSVLPFGEVGLVEVFSLATLSYPGHILLTEDLGRIIGEDSCQCGRLGRYFEIIGRLEQAELRGCSDTYVI